MKLYRRHTEVTDKEEMHLEVDHSLEPVTMPDEGEIEKQAEQYLKDVSPVGLGQDAVVKQDFREGFKAALTYLMER